MIIAHGIVIFSDIIRYSASPFMYISTIETIIYHFMNKGNIMHRILFLLVLFILSACNELGTDKNQVRKRVNEQNPLVLQDNQPEITAMLGKTSFREIAYYSIPESFNHILDIDSLLTMYIHTSSDRKKVAILRQTLIATHFRHVRSLDSLRFLGNADLLHMLNVVFHVDIEADPNELPKKAFIPLLKKLDTLLSNEATHADIIRYINNDIFRYDWMHYEFIRISDRLIKCAYNAGGMAGSAHNDVFLYTGTRFKQVRFNRLFKTLNRIMTKVVKEDAYVDIDRFDITIEELNKGSRYSVECIVQVYSGASCCPPYIIQFETRDFASFEKGTLQYATTLHLSKPQIKPDWKHIQ